MSSRLGAPALAWVLLLASCGAEPPLDAGTDLVLLETLRPTAPPIAPATSCEVRISRESRSDNAHAMPCSPLEFPYVPPVQGRHYSVWADFGVYEAPVPWGFLVHSMEHGAIVITYACGDACPEVRSALEALIRDYPVDPRCDGHPLGKRMILAPAADLPYAIGVSAWQHQYVASCLDLPSLRAFVDAHYARGPENTCSGGADYSASGWCAPDAGVAVDAAMEAGIPP